MKAISSIFISTILPVILIIAAYDSHIAFAQAQVDQRGLRIQQSEQVKKWPDQSKRWALIIGVDQYKDRQISSLSGAANDAKHLADALEKYAGLLPDQVILLATDQPEERQPTRVNILRRLSNLTAVVPKDGLLLVAFAGHGIERGGQAYLLPSDAQISDDVSFLEETALSVSRIKERIKATGVQQVIMMLDACRNDPTGRAAAPNNLTEAYTRGFNFDVRNNEVEAFATLYATAVGERAYEYTEKRQGYFTWALVEGLKGGGANDKGEITLGGLIKFIQDVVPKRIGIDLGPGRNQKPFAVVEGYKADELVIALANPASARSNSIGSEPSTAVPTIEKKSTDISVERASGGQSVKQENPFEVLRPSELKPFKIGIYYRADNLKAKKVADLVKAAIENSKSVALVTVYPRDLSFFEASVAPDGNEIRYEEGIEVKAARELSELLSQKLPSINFILVTVGSRTPRFISIFISIDK
jgi:hypothetical protein